MEYQVRILNEIRDTSKDGNVDVVLEFANGERYGATFFTLDNIRSLFDEWATTGECLNGLYVWASNMIIVQRLDQWTIEQTIAHLVATDEFAKAMERLNPS